MDNTIINYQESKDSTLFTRLTDYESHRLIDEKCLIDFNKPSKIRAVGYLRVSMPSQAKKDKASLPEQRSDIESYIIKSGWENVGLYEDKGKSGKKIVGRDEFLRMVKEDAPKGLFDVIVGWHTDRLARNADEMTDLRADLRKIGVQATSVLEPIEITDPKRLLFENPGIKKLLAFLLDWKAEQDNFTRTERLNLGKQGKAKKGLIPCKAPYGYRKCIYYENGDRNKKVEEDIIVPEEARVVTLIYDSYDFKGMGLRKIAVHLNDKGISAPRGGEWCYSTVKYILQNVTYIGVVRWGWRLSCSKISRARLQAGHQGLIEKGMHEPIISEEQFERVKKKLESRKKLGGRAVASKGLLTGLLKCGICGENAYISSYPRDGYLVK